MDYQFIRKLVKDVQEKDKEKILSILQNNGIETLALQEQAYVNVVDILQWNGKDLYVSAADLEHARKLIEELEMNSYLCSEKEAHSNGEKTELEKAEEEFYRKHKQNQIFAWCVIGLVILFMIFQFFAK